MRTEDSKNLKPEESLEVVKALANETLPLKEQCTRLNLFMRNHELPNFRSSALVVAMEVISGTQLSVGQEFVDALLDSIFKAINSSSTKIDQTCGQCIVSNLVNDFRLL